MGAYWQQCIINLYCPDLILHLQGQIYSTSAMADITVFNVMTFIYRFYIGGWGLLHGQPIRAVSQMCDPDMININNYILKCFLQSIHGCPCCISSSSLAGRMLTGILYLLAT
jgi:hypothetical protein